MSGPEAFENCELDETDIYFDWFWTSGKQSAVIVKPFFVE
jgi:hypothetical protein